MIKVIIADDEDKICQLIHRLVDWERLEMQVVAFAHNGIEALDLVKKQQPDILITDIRMPGYDGLEMIRLAKKEKESLYFIIISGYRHFEYAQTAIKYGVSDYLLKPVNQKELVETLQKMKVLYQQRMQQLSKEEQRLISFQNTVDQLRNSLFTEVLNVQNEPLKPLSLEMMNTCYQYHFKSGCFQFLTVKIDGLKNSNLEQSLEEKIRQVALRDLKEYCYDMELFFKNGSAYCLLNYKEDNKKQIRKQFKQVLDELVLQKDVFDELEITLGVGSSVENPEELKTSLKIATWAMKQRLVLGTKKVISGKFSGSDDVSNSPLVYHFNKEMTKAVDRMDEKEVSICIDHLKNGLKERKETTGEDVIKVVKEIGELYLFSMRKNNLIVENGDVFIENLIREINTYSAIDRIFDYLSESIGHSLKQVVKEKRESDIKPIRQAKIYIQTHYMKSLSLDEVGEIIGFNGSYFSSLFKKETGHTFLEYLSEVRMEHAKELLKETNDSVAVICGKVGYNDLKHFTKNFAKHTGLKPNEYRKLYA